MPTMPELLVGEVWDLEFGPQVGREQGGRRPALVISNDEFNRTPNELCIIVPITGRDRGIRYHVRLAPPEGGLTKSSVIMCDQARSQSQHRFRRHRGSVSIDTLRLVQEMVGKFIDR